MSSPSTPTRLPPAHPMYADAMTDADNADFMTDADAYADSPKKQAPDAPRKEGRSTRPTITNDARRRLQF